MTQGGGAGTNHLPGTEGRGGVQGASCVPMKYKKIKSCKNIRRWIKHLDNGLMHISVT